MIKNNSSQSGDPNLLETHQVALVTRLNQICMLIAGAIILVELILQRFPQTALLISLIIFGYLPVMWFLKKGKHQTARITFVASTYIVVSFLSFYNLYQRTSVQGEYYFIAVSVIILLFLDGFFKNGAFILVTFQFIICRLIRISVEKGILDNSSIMSITIDIATFATLYYLVNTYKKFIGRLVIKQNELNLKLSKQTSKLEEMIKTQNKLFSIVAHDLNKPFMLLNELIHLENDKVINRKQGKEYRKRINEYLKNLGWMMEDLLIWVRSQMEGFKTVNEKVKISALVKEVIPVYQQMAKTKEITIEIDIPDELIAVVDKNHLRLVTRNIISNCIKFTPKGGKIKLSGITDGPNTILLIKDTGVGMNEETIEKVLSNKIVNPGIGTDGEHGSGLGLSLSVEVLRKNNGRMAILSKRKKGSEFIISLPSANR